MASTPLVAPVEELVCRAPRLGADDRMLLLPTRTFWWAGAAGMALVAIMARVAVLRGVGLSTAALLPETWLWWLPVLALCAVGAWFRPGGLDARAWVGIWLEYLSSPRRAVYKPIYRRGLTGWW